MKKYLTCTVLASIMCAISVFAGACSCSDVRVSEIFFEKGAIELTVGDSLDCTPESLGLQILPTNASDKRVVFTIEQDKDKNGNRVNVLDDSNRPNLIAKNVGVATIHAKSYDGVKVASISVRVYPKNYSLTAPTISVYDDIVSGEVDNVYNTAIMWDKQYIKLGTHDIDEVFYHIELNGQDKGVTQSNVFYDFPSGVWNTIKVQATTSPKKTGVVDSSYSILENFYVLNAPQNLTINNGVLTWDTVENADSYIVVTYKKDENGTLTEPTFVDGIKTNTYTPEITEAGNYVFEVKAVPSDDAENMYTSKGSNQVSVIKLDTIQSLSLSNDILTWNEVVNAQEYNIVLLNKNTNEIQKINVKNPSVGQENISYDLKYLNLAGGEYNAKIETISKSSTGLNSEISEVSVDFTQLAKPYNLGIINNSLIWEGVPKDTKVQIKVDDTDMGIVENFFCLPEYFEPGEYKIYMKAIGDGESIVSSNWYTEEEAYTAIKLTAPTTMTNKGYDFTVGKVENAFSYVFEDVYSDGEYAPKDVVIKNVRQTEVDYTATIYVEDKVSKDSGLLSKNKYTIKARAVGASGSNYFMSDLSECSITFNKLFAVDDANANALGDGTIEFKCSHPNIIAYPDNESKQIMESLQKIDEFGEPYYDILIQVIRINKDNREEEIFQKIVSVDSDNLALEEFYNTEGGELIFRVSLLGNESNILHGDGVIAKERDTDNDFILYRAYAPKDFTVTNTTLNWNVEEKNNEEYFRLAPVEHEVIGDIIYQGFNMNFDLNAIVTNPDMTYNFAMQNRSKIINPAKYWADSMVVYFQVGRLHAPVISFRDNFIEWDVVPNALFYHVYINGERVPALDLRAEDAVDGKLSIDYTQYLVQGKKEKTITIVASMGVNSTKLLINSKMSNALTVRTLSIENVKVQNNQIILTPNFNYDVKLMLSLYHENSLEQALYSGDITELDSKLSAFVFNPKSYIDLAGYYTIKFNCVYTGSQSENVRYIVKQDYIIQNIFNVLSPLQLTYHEAINGNRLITWAEDANAQSYEVIAKNVDTEETYKQEVSAGVNTYNLTNFPNLTTGAKYIFAVISVGSGNYNGVINTKSLNNQTIISSNYAYFSSKESWLEDYGSGRDTFSKVGDIKNFASSVDGTTITFSWDKEENVKYEIFKNDELLITQAENTYTYNFDVQSETSASFKVRGISTTDTANITASSFTTPIVIEVLNEVTDLKVQGVITFNHDKEDCKYKVVVIDEANGQEVYVGTFTSKEIDLSSVTQIVAGKTYTIKVFAVSNGTTYIDSNYTQITEIQKAPTPTISIDEETKLFVSSEVGAYVKFMASKYVDGAYQSAVSSSPLDVTSPECAFDLSSVADAGQYKVWVVAQNTQTGENVLYSNVSNLLYVTLLEGVSNVEIVNGMLTFLPTLNQDRYLVKIGDVEKEIKITDTENIYSYLPEEFKTAGTYNVQIRTKGNYTDATNEDFSCTIHSAYTESIQVIKLGNVSNIAVKDNAITWDSMENAQGYNIVFSQGAEEKFNFNVLNNVFDLSTIQFESGTYTFTIQALGNDALNIINGDKTNGNINLNVAYDKALTLSLNAVSKRFEWENVDNAYGYMVSMVNDIGQIEIFNTLENYFVVPESVASGSYNVYVQVKGDNANVLPSKQSNVISIEKLPQVTSVIKTQTAEQDHSSKASIYFEQISGIQDYEIVITKPDNSKQTISYTYDESAPYEYEFTTAGVYTFDVYAEGDYISNINSNKQTLTLTKLDKLQNMTYKYSLDSAKGDINYTIAWGAHTQANANKFDIELQHFVNVDATSIYVSNESGDKVSYSAKYMLNTLLQEGNNTVKGRVYVPLDNQEYVGSDWQEIVVYVYKKVENVVVQNDRVYFNINAEETHSADIKQMIVDIYDNELNILGSYEVNYGGTGQVVLTDVMKDRGVGTYYIGLRVMGNKSNLIPSNKSDLIEFNKLSSTNITVEETEAGSQSGNISIKWDAVDGATRYEVWIDDTSYIVEGKTYFEIDTELQGLNKNKYKAKVYCLGEEGYLKSNASNEITLKVATNNIKLSIANGSIIIGEISGGTFDETLIDNVILNIEGQCVRPNALSYDLDSRFAGNDTFDIKAKILPDSITTEEEGVYNVNSYYNEVLSVYRLPDALGIQIIDGEIYVNLVKFGVAPDANPEGPDAGYIDEEGNRVRAKVEVMFGESREVIDVSYNEENIGTPIKIGYPKSMSSGVALKVKYRVIGDSKNLSSNYSNILIDLEATQLKAPTSVYAVDSELKWDAVSNASGYYIYMCHDYKEKDKVVAVNDLIDDAIISNPHAVIKVPANQTSYNINSLLDYLVENSTQKDNIIKTVNLNVKFVVQAIGSASIVENGMTYLSSIGKSYAVTRFITPTNLTSEFGQINCINQNEILDVEIDGKVYRWTKDSTYTQDEWYETCFPNEGEYTVRIKVVGNQTTTFDSGWSDYAIYYKISTITSVYIQEGFIVFESPKSFYEGDLATIQNNGAYKSISIKLGENVYTFDKFVTSLSPDGQSYVSKASLYSQTKFGKDYVDGFLDDLKAGLNTIKVRVSGGTTPEGGTTLFLNGNYSQEFKLQKLGTVQNVQINSNKLTWDHVEGNNGYIISVTNSLDKDGETKVPNIIQIDKSNDGSTCVLDLLNNRDFLSGTYTISIRALGDNSILISSNSEEKTIKVFKQIQDLSVFEGQIMFGKQDTEAKKYTISGEYVQTGMQFSHEIVLNEEDTSINVLYELPDEIITSTGSTINLPSGDYVIKVKATGDGQTTIDGEYSLDFPVTKLPQVDYISSAEGKLVWSPVNDVKGYKVYIKSKDAENPEYFTLDVTDSDKSGGNFVADIPKEVFVYGDVEVKIKAKGDNEFLNGSYSSILEATKLIPATELSVNTSGNIIWTCDSAGTKGFKLVVENAEGNSALEHKEMTTAKYMDFPQVLVEDDLTQTPLNAGDYQIRIKNVGQELSGKHYLSSYSAPLLVNKLNVAQQVHVQNGILEWKKVPNAFIYEITFNHSNKIVVGPIRTSGNVEASSTDYIAYAMDEEALEEGSYDSITIRSIGGSKTEEILYYVNSNLAKIEDIYKLSKPANITTSINEEGKVELSFLPISYAYKGETLVIKDYTIKITNRSLGNKVTYENFKVDGDVSATSPIAYVFNDEKYPTGSYTVAIKANSPNGDTVNSSYSDTISVTKPAPPKNLTFSNDKKCFTWEMPEGIDASQVTFEIAYLFNAKGNVFTPDNVQTVSVNNVNYYYPAVLGYYKIIIRASIEGSLKSDYIGANNKAYSSVKDMTLGEFINEYGVSGTNNGLFSGGDGTESNPYQIKNYTEFSNMRYYSASNFYFKLMNDIGSNSNPVSSSDLLTGSQNKLGGEGNPFKANLNGNGKVIYINTLNVTGRQTVQGLFAYCEDANISNLTLSIRNTVSVPGINNLELGLFIGRANNVRLSNVMVRGAINIPTSNVTSSYTMYIGGVVGTARGVTHFEQVVNEANVAFNNYANVGTKTTITAYVGGIVAQHSGAGSDYAFNNCMNKGVIAGTIAGGIVAKTIRGIQSSANVGNVYAYRSNSTTPYAGGLVGTAGGDGASSLYILNSYNRGNVSSKTWGTGTKAYAGGIVGQVDEAFGSVQITNAFIAGTVNVYRGTVNINNEKTSGWAIAVTSGVGQVLLQNVYFVGSGTSANDIVGVYDVNTLTRQNINPNERPTETDVANNLNSYFNGEHKYINSSGKININGLPE